MNTLPTYAMVCWLLRPMFEYVMLLQRFAETCYLKGPRHDPSIERLAKRLGRHAGLGNLFPLRKLATNTSQCSIARRKPPKPAKSSITPTDPLDLGVACWSSCRATCPCAVKDDVREKRSSHSDASEATTSGLTLGGSHTHGQNQKDVFDHGLWEKPAASPLFFRADPLPN